MNPTAVIPTPGTIVANRYRVLAEIPTSGTSTTFRAAESNGREVAIKVLPWAHEEHAKFDEAASAARALSHHNIAPLLDAGRTEHGIPFVVYELLSGQNVAQMIASSGAAPPNVVTEVALQVLDALEAAHARGVIHGNLTPANIFLSHVGGHSYHARILDFGVPISDALTGPDETSAGAPAGVKGASYMAPERVHGAGIGAHTDVYALGLVLAEALTGQTIVRAASTAMTAIEQASDKPVLLPAAVLQSPLGAAIRRATQKPLERRYATAAEMRAEIQAIADGAAASRDVTRPSAVDLARATANTGTMVAVAPQAHSMDPASLQYASAQPLSMQHHAAPSFTAGVPPTAAAYTQPSPGIGGGFHTQPAYGYTNPSPPTFQPPTFPLQPGPGYAPPAKNTNTALWIVLSIVGLLALIVVTGMIVLVAVVSSDDGGKRSSGGQSDSASLEDLTPAALRRRLERAGWEIIGESTSSNASFKVDTYTVRRANKTGVAQLYRYQDASAADIVFNSFRDQSRSAVTRDGGTILLVTIVAAKGNPKQLSQDALDEIK